ncbi:hypothetical protein ACXWR7_11845, partial [Streptococcus pyogenes]
PFPLFSPFFPLLFLSLPLPLFLPPFPPSLFSPPLSLSLFPSSFFSFSLSIHPHNFEGIFQHLYIFSDSTFLF